MQKIRVLVIDDHPVVRRGLRSLLSQYPDIEMVGEADGGAQTMGVVSTVCPDVILLDIRLAGLDGLDLARRLRHSYAKSRIVIVTAHDDKEYLLQAARAGVHGYMLKSAPGDALANAIRVVQSGEYTLSPSLADAAFHQLQIVSKVHVRSPSDLSEEDVRLLQLIADGTSIPGIALALDQSERTINRKTQEILEKLEVASRIQAVAEGFRRGLLM